MGASFDRLRVGAENAILKLLNDAFDPANIGQRVLDQSNPPLPPFQSFQIGTDLKDTYASMGIVPQDSAERAAWFTFLDSLKSIPSAYNQANGHDDIVAARRNNLEGSSPLPMLTLSHSYDMYPRVIIARGCCDYDDYPNQPCVIISSPIMPRPSDRNRQRGA
jgi:hypothetical protein